jgi:hypothetical protein
LVAPEVTLVAGAGHDHQAVDSARGERLGQFALARLVFVGGPDEGQDAVGARDVFDAAMHRSEERVGDILDDQADAGRLAVRAPQRAGGDVAPVAEQPHGLVDALGQLGTHLAGAVEHA